MAGGADSGSNRARPAAGRHVIQVRKPGYVGYVTEVEVETGETSNVDVTLRRQP